MARPGFAIGPGGVGAATIVVALAVIVAGSILIGTPPFGIPGALVVTLGTVFVALGFQLTLRRSWSDPWLVGRPPNPARRRRIQAILPIFWAMFASLTLAGIVYALVAGDYSSLPIALLWFGVSVVNLIICRRAVVVQRERAEVADTWNDEPRGS